MNTEDRLKATDDITCGQCGKANGKEKVGTSWICADCKVSEDTSQTEQIVN